MGNTRNKKLLLLGLSLSILAVAGYGFYSWQQSHADRSKQISYTTFMQKVTAGSIVKVKIVGEEISADAKNGEKYSLFLPVGANLAELLIAKKVDFSSNPPSGGPRWFEIGFLVAIAIFLFAVLKRFTGMGKSRAKIVEYTESRTRFTDVAGAEEAKTELLDTVEFLKDPEKFSILGGKMPTGVLLVGPPGTGKTLIARAVAGEADVPFFSISGSEFVEMYVGVGASRVRDLFAQAKKAAPCIVFIDEIDAVGRKRDAAAGGGASDERDQTLNQLLVEMDGFEVNSGIVVLAATNRPEILDAALLRSGRFDRQVTVGSPDVRGREAILKVHVKNVPLHAEVDLRVIARGTPGMSGADLANVVNEAAILAARSNKNSVEMIDFDLAKDKVLMGAEKKSIILSDKLKLSTAYHEAGHVLVAKLIPGCDPVHKVTIIPRGRAMGVTIQIPEDDVYCYTKEMLMAHLKVLMGGRAAEEMIYHTTTTGAGNDLARATDTARRMVSEWGMSRAFGPVAFGHQENTDSSGGPRKGFSDTTALEMDNEIRSIVSDCYADVLTLLKENSESLERLTRELVAKETLDAAEIDAILGFGDDDTDEPISAAA